jgi:hypothetical protein
MKGAAKSICKLAVCLKINCSAGGGDSLKLLAFSGDRRATSSELALAFAELVRTTKIDNDLSQYVGKPARPFRVARALDK